MNRKRWTALALLCAIGIAHAGTAMDADAKGKALAPYRTQLFNLLLDQKNVLDQKNHYQPAFGARFDALLASSALARTDKSGIALKKRLLSGPAGEPALLVDAASGTQWLHYDACQAHRCDEVSLGLLFDPVSRRMLGKLNLNKASEYLGAPSAAEQRLIGQGRVED